MIVETGYYYAWQPDVKSPGADLSKTYPISPAGQQAFTKALIETLNKHPKVTGLFWWMMEACENGLDWNTKRVTDGWYNASLFNDTDTSVGTGAGYAMPALYELKSFLPSSDGISNVITGKVADNNWYSLDGHLLKNKPASKGIYINNKKKVIIK
jgi:arabinogalactan endo-1,4-beta-galactosidase